MARQQKPRATQVAIDSTEAIVEAAPRKSLFERVAGYLDENNWNYTAHQENTYFSMGCRIKDANVRVILDVYQADAWCRVLGYSNYPVFIPEQKRAAVLEAITRINYSIIYGNLEMDLSDGELRVRTVVESETELSDGMLERVLNANLSIADRHFGAILSIAFGNAMPESVLELASRPETSNLQ